MIQGFWGHWDQNFLSPIYEKSDETRIFEHYKLSSDHRKNCNAQLRAHASVLLLLV